MESSTLRRLGGREDEADQLIEEADRLFEAVKSSGRKYMMFETSCFHEDLHAMREIYRAGGLGKLVYSEGEYFTYADELEERYSKQVKGVVDTGPLEQAFSTVLDMSDFPPEVIREGKGPIDDLF